MKRLELFNYLIQEKGYKSYLEIGVQNPAKNFDQVICEHKIGVDPDPNAQATKVMTSDDFFANNTETFDLIFIDGLHHDDQVEKDAHNALKILNEGGTIVWHDCNPDNEPMQRVPRETKAWTGNVWRAWVKMRRIPTLEMFVLNDDLGLGIMRKGKQEPLIVDNPTYEGLEKNRKEWLNLKDANYDNL